MAINDPSDVRSLADLKSETKLLAIFLEYCKRERGEDNVLFYFAKGSTQSIYETYLDVGGSRSVCLSSGLSRRIQSLVNQTVSVPDPRRWDDPSWKRFMDDAKNEIASMLARDTLMRFAKTPAYEINGGPDIIRQPVEMVKNMKRNAKLWAAFFAFAKNEHSDENVLFFYGSGSNDAVYEKYISANARKQVNLSDAVRNRLDALANRTIEVPDPNRWDSPQWSRLIDEAKEEVDSAMMLDAWKRFIKTEECIKYFVGGKSDKAAKLLGIRNVNALNSAIKERNESKRLALLEALAEEDNIKMKARVLNENLKALGLI